MFHIRRTYGKGFCFKYVFRSLMMGEINSAVEKEEAMLQNFFLLT